MSKKILVIENDEEFRERLNLATIQSVCVVADVIGLLKGYERDVIEFEAEYTRKNAFLGFSSQLEDGTHLIGNFGEDFNKWQDGDEIKVLVVKLKKPEGK